MLEENGMKNTRKILSNISNINEFNKDNRTIFLQCFKSKNSEIREKSLEKMLECSESVQFDSEILRSIRNMLKDTEELVRCNVLELFEYHIDLTDFDELVYFLNDQSPLVREQAAHNLGILGDRRAISPLFERLKIAIEPEKVRIYFALYLLGEAEALKKLMNMLKSRDPSARGATANFLPDIYSTTLGPIFVAKLSKALSNERTNGAAVRIRDSIYRIVEMIFAGRGPSDKAPNTP